MGKNRCAVCNKEKASFRCGGCSQDFCYKHVADHRQQLDQQLDEIEAARDLFRQTLTQQTSEPQRHVFIQTINQWENSSIDKIKQTAEDARQLVFKHTEKHFVNIEEQLSQLTNQLRENREENDFVETDLNRWNDELKRLTEELDKPAFLTIQQNSTPLVTEICVNIPSKYSYHLTTKENRKFTEKSKHTCSSQFNCITTNLEYITVST